MTVSWHVQEFDIWGTSRKEKRQWQPTPILLPGKSHGQRSLVGCSPWGCEESDMTERLHFHFSLSSIGEGNGNPLQYSCLENPRDGGAWWAAIYGVAQSQTWLKRLSSSSSSRKEKSTKTESDIGLWHNFPGPKRSFGYVVWDSWGIMPESLWRGLSGQWTRFPSKTKVLAWLCSMEMRIILGEKIMFQKV